ncbi:MAG: hypothetical protein JW838_00840 [Spirochaetes bacterium]|nr:hypothetical protein [Spirochaetota bacterium]
MASTNAIEKKWRSVLVKNRYDEYFGVTGNKGLPGDGFYLRYSDAGGTGACYVSVTVTGVFEDARNCLGFLRFAEIPRLLHEICRGSRGRIERCESYLGDLDARSGKRMKELLSLLDRTIRKKRISGEDLASIRKMYNASFKSTNPTVKIMAWGGLSDFLKARCFAGDFRDDIEEEIDEGNERGPIDRLRGLLKKGMFDESSREHRELADMFLERREC